MAEKIVVKAEKRETRGKGHARRLRVDGKIPVVVYGGGSESMSATVSLKDLAAIIRTETSVNTVFALDVAGEGIHDVIFQDRQIDAVKGRLIHADLRRFAKGEKIEMTVPIRLTGHAVGLQDVGAVLTQAMREIKVLCEPANTPDSIDVDVTNLEAGQSLHVSDLVVGAGIEIALAPETVVASVVTVEEAVLEPQIEEGAQPEVAGEKPEAAPEGGEDT
ncbi:MAG: 50S ribosomal protein L25 [Chloracidobacterium sp.]|nr:50S ribosomal protein L25 [Chloracidobacterium sp.]